MAVAKSSNPPASEKSFFASAEILEIALGASVDPYFTALEAIAFTALVAATAGSPTSSPVNSPAVPSSFIPVTSFIAFSAAILAAYSFYKSSINESLKSEWLPLARGSFYIHGISVLGIIVCMFIMIYNHYFEYQYVWQHSSKSLPTRYMISCFWEGQEGSFLLWIFWNIILFCKYYF